MSDKENEIQEETKKTDVEKKPAVKDQAEKKIPETEKSEEKSEKDSSVVFKFEKGKFYKILHLVKTAILLVGVIALTYIAIQKVKNPASGGAAGGYGMPGGGGGAPAAGGAATGKSGGNGGNGSNGRQPAKGNGGSAGPGAGGGYGSGRSTVTSVRTVVAEAVTLQDFLVTNGEVETQTSLDVFPSMGGALVQLNISLGSSVKKGDVIAYVDPSEPGSYYAKSPVKAPISGSVISSTVKPGTKVTANTVIAKIGDIDNLQVVSKIPERYIAELKIGQKAEISLEAYPEEVFEASVVKISPVLDSATRTKDIILNFSKKDSKINAGMFANVKLYTTAYSGAIAVQQDALVNNNDKYYLYVVNEDGQTVTKRQVTLGKNVDGYYQILEGIKEGETVVVEGMLTLAEGSMIKDITPGRRAGDMEASGNNQAEHKGNR